MARQRKLPPARPMFYGGPDPITLNRMERLVTNIRSIQRDAVNRSAEFDPRRDLDDECGYPKGNLTSEQYKDLIDREPLAAIVNAVYALEAWQEPPTLFEDESAETITDLEAAWDELPSQLGVEPSYHGEEEGSVIWSHLQEADILCGYGRHGGILFGFGDGKRLDEPVTPQKGMKLNFIRSFPEHLCRVTAFETDTSSRRFGHPTQYQVTFSDPNDTTSTSINENYTSETVHWSRVLHVADTWHQASPSPFFAVPRIRPVLNPILDARKVRGSSAEMYYKGAFGGHHFGTHPQLGPDVDIDPDDMRDMYEEFINGLQRALFTSGMNVTSLAPQVVDPSPQLMVYIEAISIETRIPKRVLLGGELGERSSQEDRKRWNNRLGSRNRMWTTPRLVVPFTNRLINVGVLPPPRKGNGFRVRWPDVAVQSEEERATVLLTRTQAYREYVEGGVETVIPVMDYMTKFDSMTEEEATAVLEAASEIMDTGGDTPAPLLGLVGGVDAMLQMFDRFKAGAISEDTLTQLLMLFYRMDEEKAKKVIADGLPDPPEGSLPALPPMKGPNSPASIQNWVTANAFCPTGPGGGVDPTCSPGGVGGAAPTAPVDRSARAKAAHKLVDKTIQRYAEEHNEPLIAGALGGQPMPDNEPVDILVGRSGIELKTMVDNGNNKITMKRSAMELKAAWERRQRADIHTLVVDDHKVFNANGPGQHDESKRVFYYRRGYGSFRVETMHKVTSLAEVKALMETTDSKLPEAAKRPKGQKRGKLK